MLKSLAHAGRRTARTIFVASAVLAATLAHADEFKAVGVFGWFGVGKAILVEKDHYYWTGEFSGSFFSDKGPGGLFHLAGIRCPAWNDLNFATGKGMAGGYCILRDKAGDQISGTWEASGVPGDLKGTFTWISGTGKYAGAKGTYPFNGVTQVNWEDGTASGYATWNR